MSRLRWDPCVYHRGDESRAFLRDFFAEPQRRLLFVAAAGFDARSMCVAKLFHEIVRGRVHGVFIKEERPEHGSELSDRAERHREQLVAWFPDSRVLSIEIFAADQAVVAGPRTIKALESACVLDGITDVILDVSALSIGVSFPMVRYLFDRVRSRRREDTPVNVHAVLVSEPTMDETLEREFMGEVSTVKGFAGSLDLVSERERTTRLWIPQLSRRKLEALQRVYKYLEDRAPLLDVCPLLPFPGKNPRRADELVFQYQNELEGRWAVDERNLVYVAEDDPLDAYRAITRLADERAEVFKAIGDSELVLSPVGHKATALGCLMAAMERDLPVLYVETLRYTAPVDTFAVRDDLEIIHVWLSGEAYPAGQGP